MRNTPTPIETSPEPSNGRSQTQPQSTAVPDAQTGLLRNASVKPQRKHLSWLVIGGLAIALVGGGVAIWHRQHQAAVVAANWEQQTRTVAVQDLTIQIEASGTVLPINTVNVSPKTAGRLAALYVQQGDQVTEGQLLAEMDAVSLRAEVAQARSQLAQSEAELAKTENGSRPEAIRRAAAAVESARATLDLNRERFDRFRELRNDGAISQDELDGQEAQFRSAQAALEEAQEQLAELKAGSRPEDIELAQARVETSQAQVQLAESRLDDMSIRAPFAGIITQVYADIGAIVTPTTSASATASATSSSILALASGLHVEVNVPEVNIREISAGQAVEIQAEAYPDQTFAGQVVAIAPEAIVEDNVTFFQVKVAILEGLDQLRSGMNVNASFQGPTITDALTVPTVAISTQKGAMGVWLADETGEATFQAVTVGVSQQGDTQIVDGLAAGDRIYMDNPKGQRPWGR